MFEDKYQIIRMYRNPYTNNRVIKSGLTLEEAQTHCRDPKTRCEGKWFDGYEKMPRKINKRGRRK